MEEGGVEQSTSVVVAVDTVQNETRRWLAVVVAAAVETHLLIDPVISYYDWY